VQLAYCLDTLANKTPYPKSEVDKKKWWEMSQELFKHTVGNF
jgi:hypothetical protein